MKIAINTLSIKPNQMGGTETFLTNLIKNLINLDPNVDFFLIVSKNNQSTFPFNSKNIRFKLINFDNTSQIKRIFIEQTLLPIWLKKEKIDCLIAPGNTGLLYSPCKVIVIVHDIIFCVYPESYSTLRRLYLQKFVKFSCTKADKVVTMSNNTKRDIGRYIGINMGKIGVIFEGVDFEYFSAKSKDDRNQKILTTYGLKEKYIYSPTSLYPHKNHEVLIKAFARLKKEKKIPHKLVITGFDPLKKEDELRDLIERFNVQNEVLYLGAIPYEHIPILYSEASLTAYLSLYEGFGLPVLEAMASGCPVICSSCSSLPEVVGNAGILVDPFDVNEIASKMHDLLTNEELKAKYVKRGLNRAREFSWESSAKKLIDVYNELLKG